MGAEPPSMSMGPQAEPVLPAGGRLRVRLAATEADVAATQALRHLCFVERAGRAARAGSLEADAFDARCGHLMVEEAGTGTLVCSFRFRVLPGGAAVGESYAAQFYDLSRLKDWPGPMAEIGRFCIRPGHRDADAVRLAWGALAGIVDAEGVGMLFGCSSFTGTDAVPYADAFALLARDHAAPGRWAPGVGAREVVALGRQGAVDRRRALAAMPPLLRTYLGMGGWVSDHAVVDRELDTLHVFTGVEIGAIPAARARALREMGGRAGAGGG